MAGLNTLSFIDGFLMARKILGDSREQALAAFEAQLENGFQDALELYAEQKLGFEEDIYYSEDFVKTMPELESWFTGLAFVLLRDPVYDQRLDLLADTEIGQTAIHFQAVFEGFMLAGPLARGRTQPPEIQKMVPTFKKAYEKFVQDLRRYGLRKRLDYVGGILGLLEGVAQMPVEKAK